MSPYSGLPDRQWWSKAVAPCDISNIADLYRRKFSIAGLRIATAGSCFAQHIAVNLRKAGYAVLDKEPTPYPFRKLPVAKKFGYELYSARYGNIYTARRLLQTAQEALGLLTPDPDAFIWESEGRFHDALRNVEPEGLPSRADVIAQREHHLRAVRLLLKEAGLFVFTFGLTEAWRHKDSGLVYSLAPFERGLRHEFVNFRFQEILDDFLAFRDLAKSQNPEMKFLLTVSPVPLIATAVDAHALPATIRSKSILRSVTAQLYEDFDDIDYFPSFDLLSTPFLGPSMFEGNKRDVRAEGVAAAMRLFLAEHPPVTRDAKPVSVDDVLCDEAMLEALA